MTPQIDVKVRAAERGDLQSIDAIINQYWKVSVDHERELANPETLMLVAEAPRDGERAAVVGTATMFLTRWNRTGLLVELAVARDWQRRGVGRALLLGMSRLAKDRDLRAIIVETQPDNKDAMDFYMANGLRMCGYNDRHYTNLPKSSHEIALFFSLDLENEV